MYYKYVLSSLHLLQKLFISAFRRHADPARSLHLCAAATALIVAGILVCATPEATVHRAATLRFLAPSLTISTPTKPLVVIPKHRAPSNDSGLLAIVDQSDILPRHRILADQVLRSLPPGCRESLKHFYVNYGKHPANRGLGGESTIIIIGTVSEREFMALLIHECGHVHDLGSLRGTREAGLTNFRDGNTPIYANDPSMDFYQISWLSPTANHTDTKDDHFVSGYAASDPFEDFAEAFAFYALHQKEFKRLAEKNLVLRAKYEFMRDVVFAGTGPVGTGQFVKGKGVPWDTTKLPYTWHAKK